jgi:hypothetical protein
LKAVQLEKAQVILIFLGRNTVESFPVGKMGKDVRWKDVVVQEYWDIHELLNINRDWVIPIRRAGG